MERRFAIATALTVCLVLLFPALIYFGFLAGPKTISDVAEVLSAVGTTAALIWVVAGYRQQGVELRNSTAALQLQAEELRNSVAAQTDLVEVARRQLAAEIEARAHDMAERKRAITPRFNGHIGTIARMDGLHRPNLHFRNFGGFARHAWIRVEGPVYDGRAERRNLDKGEELLIQVEFHQPERDIECIKVYSMDTDGDEHCQVFRIRRTHGDSFELVELDAARGAAQP